MGISSVHHHGDELGLLPQGPGGVPHAARALGEQAKFIAVVVN